mgnify:FL=1
MCDWNESDVDTFFGAMMKWISVNDLKPLYKDAGYSETVLISDGKSVSIGYYEFEYFAEDPNETLQYSSDVWHDDANLLNADHDGWPEVTHWALLPHPPEE